MPKFKYGTSVNRCNDWGRKYPRLRIKAGPLRDIYVDALVLEAKLGRPIKPGYTVEHLDGDSLNCRPEKLIEVTRGINTQMMWARRKRAAAEQSRAEQSRAMRHAYRSDERRFVTAEQVDGEVYIGICQVREMPRLDEFVAGRRAARNRALFFGAVTFLMGVMLGVFLREVLAR